jgi:hypothetical protein
MLLRLFCDVVYATDVGGIPTDGCAILVCTCICYCCRGIPTDGCAIMVCTCICY